MSCGRREESRRPQSHEARIQRLWSLLVLNVAAPESPQQAAARRRSRGIALQAGGVVLTSWVKAPAIQEDAHPPWRRVIELDQLLRKNGTGRRKSCGRCRASPRPPGPGKHRHQHSGAVADVEIGLQLRWLP